MPIQLIASSNHATCEDSFSFLASANAVRVVGTNAQTAGPFFAWLDGSEVYRQVAAPLATDPLNLTSHRILAHEEQQRLLTGIFERVSLCLL